MFNKILYIREEVYVFFKGFDYIGCRDCFYFCIFEFLVYSIYLVRFDEWENIKIIIEISRVYFVVELVIFNFLISLYLVYL